MKSARWIWWIGCAALLAAATPATADAEQPEECRWQGEEIVCPPLVLEELRDAYFDLEEELAITSAALTRCEGEVIIHRAALDSRPEPRRHYLHLSTLGTGIVGGACLAADDCHPAIGWTAVGLAVLMAIFGH